MRSMQKRNCQVPKMLWLRLWDKHQSILKYIENHLELLDFLVGCYKNLDIALNCGNMCRGRGGRRGGCAGGGPL
ncbi:hypothetical protein BDA96_03G226200 [Sorghum bicolor]|uniref:Uncharacterized protein n=2 Tax=Sorghum bicolor TaxID=4558 RepID=A0A921RFJ0_SORBI|nr:hypothetical protein BDA96_03G226200 [Sorghum bicolor]KXG32825.1 hypothetical protein SORBI_3003G208100 [Sorghum bicolor]